MSGSPPVSAALAIYSHIPLRKCDDDEREDSRHDLISTTDTY